METTRSIQRVVRLTPDESKLIDESAAHLGLTPASYLRHLGTNKRLPRTGKLDRDAQRELWKQVAGMARNMNQITIKANSLDLKKGELESLSLSIESLMKKIQELSNERR